MSTTTVNVELGARAYPIRIGAGLLGTPGALRPLLAGDSALVVSNDTVAPLYLQRVVAALGDVRVAECVLPDGEGYKDLATLERVFDAAIDGGCDRDTTVVALGGGVVGDMAGFAAAVYQRGVACIQLPTTLLAQVDSSVGGKTGVNHPRGKNMIGAFHQPRAVIADTETLDSLDDRQLSAGLAEVIKYGLIADAPLFEWLEANLEALLGREREALAHAIERSCRNKAAIVADDEHEHGRRALLNLGHTFGHAIETATGYDSWLHGEAVAAGTCMAAALSERLGWLTAAERERIESLLRRARLPVAPPAVGRERMRALMAGDKKARGGYIRVVLLDTIGRARLVDDVPDEALDATLAAADAAGAPA